MDEVRPGIFTWTRTHPDIGVPVTAFYVVGEDGTSVLIDPMDATEEFLTAVERMGAPAAILLSNPSHERFTAWWKERLGVPVLAHPATRGALPALVDADLEDGARTAGGLAAMHVGGVHPGEIAWYDGRNGGTLILGDALAGTLAGEWRLLRDQEEIRAAARRLLALDFATALPSHGGAPVLDAKRRLGELLGEG